MQDLDRLGERDPFRQCHASTHYLSCCQFLDELASGQWGIESKLTRLNLLIQALPLGDDTYPVALG